MHLLCFIPESTTISASSYYDKALTCAFKSHGQCIYWIIFCFWFTVQLQIISCPIIWFKTLLHGPYWKKTPWTTKHNFFFNYHATSEYNNLIPCNSVFFENFSNYFCVHCYQTRVLVLLLVTDMYQYPHPLISYHLFTQVTFTVSHPLHTIQIYLISHVSVSSVMVENTEAN